MVYCAVQDCESITFSNRDIIEYLYKVFNKSSQRFKVINSGKVISASFDGIDFNFSVLFSSSIKFSFKIDDKPKLKEIFYAIMQWDKFSNAKRKSVRSFNSGDNQTVILESNHQLFNYYNALRPKVLKF